MLPMVEKVSLSYHLLWRWAEEAVVPRQASRGEELSESFEMLYALDGLVHLELVELEEVGDPQVLAVAPAVLALEQCGLAS